MVKIAINGFGRIGRLAFRKIFVEDNMEVVAINDLTDSRTLSHLLKYDSSQKRFDAEISYDEDNIIVNGKKRTVLVMNNCLLYKKRINISEIFLDIKILHKKCQRTNINK